MLRRRVGLLAIRVVDLHPGHIHRVLARRSDSVAHGSELADDPEHERRVAEGEVTDVAAPASKLDGAELTRAKGSVIVFALAVMILSHSLMIPGLVATISAIVIGFLLAQAVV